MHLLWCVAYMSCSTLNEESSANIATPFRLIHRKSILALSSLRNRLGSRRKRQCFSQPRRLLSQFHRPQHHLIEFHYSNAFRHISVLFVGRRSNGPGHNTHILRAPHSQPHYCRDNICSQRFIYNIHLPIAESLYRSLRSFKRLLLALCSAYVAKNLSL